MKKQLIALLVLVLIFGVIVLVFPCSIKNGIFKSNISCKAYFQKSELKGSDSTTTPVKQKIISTDLQKLNEKGIWETQYPDLEKRPLYLNNNYLVASKLILGIGTSTNAREEVWVINLKTGKEKLLYVNSRFVNDEQISSIAEFKNALYIFTQGMYGYRAIHSIDFPLEDNNVVELKAYGRAIKEIAGNYWVESNGGDGCMNFSKYSLFDPKTKSIVGSIEGEGSCVSGVRIFISKNEAYKFYYLEKIQIKDGVRTSRYELTDVSKINFSNFKNEEYMISEKDMPSGITDITYNEENDTLQLLGDEKYVFDLKTKILSKKDFPKLASDDSSTNTVPQKETSPMISYTGDEVIQKLKSINLPNGYRLVMVEK